MKRNIFRILSVFIAVALLAVLCVPAFAASGSAYEQKVGFWNWIAGKGSILNGFIGNTIGRVCPKSEDGYHHANSYQAAHEDGYFTCICSYCGKTFTAYESDLQQSYQQQVSTLPVPGYNSAGRLIWQPTISDVIVDESTVNGNSSFSGILNTTSTSPRYFSTLANSNGFHVVYSGSDWHFGFDICFRNSIDGSYRQIESCIYTGSFLLNSGTVEKVYKDYSADSVFSHRTVDSLSRAYLGFSSILSSNSLRSTYGAFDWYFPVYEIIPDSAIDTTPGGQYSITTRPTTITGGNYGIIGDGNQITTITDNRQIINEGDNIYYNPATGQTQTITDWTYNYDGRIYNITLDTGDKVSVEYGDENITITENTINEGDTIVNNYTIYYMIDGTGSGDNPDPTPGPTACPHEWYKTGERQATCLVPAQRTYTCSICGEQKTETDPVLGHSWHAIQTVTTQYDESGNMTQEGYTIYECERCGEQYKSTNDTGPPPSGGGGSGGGSGDNIFSGIFGLIWDFFTFLFDMFSEFVVGGIKGFISGLKDAGSSFFSILNPFSWDYGG